MQLCRKCPKPGIGIQVKMFRHIDLVGTLFLVVEYTFVFAPIHKQLKSATFSKNNNWVKFTYFIIPFLLHGFPR